MMHDQSSSSHARSVASQDQRGRRRSRSCPADLYPRDDNSSFVPSNYSETLVDADDSDSETVVRLNSAGERNDSRCSDRTRTRYDDYGETHSRSIGSRAGSIAPLAYRQERYVRVRPLAAHVAAGAAYERRRPHIDVPNDPRYHYTAVRGSTPTIVPEPRVAAWCHQVGGPHMPVSGHAPWPAPASTVFTARAPTVVPEPGQHRTSYVQRGPGQVSITKRQPRPPPPRRIPVFRPALQKHVWPIVVSVARFLGVINPFRTRPPRWYRHQHFSRNSTTASLDSGRRTLDSVGPDREDPSLQLAARRRGDRRDFGSSSSDDGIQDDMVPTNNAISGAVLVKAPTGMIDLVRSERTTRRDLPTPHAGPALLPDMYLDRDHKPQGRSHQYDYYRFASSYASSDEGYHSADRGNSHTRKQYGRNGSVYSRGAPRSSQQGSYSHLRRHYDDEGYSSSSVNSAPIAGRRPSTGGGYPGREAPYGRRTPSAAGSDRAQPYYTRSNGSGRTFRHPAKRHISTRRRFFTGLGIALGIFSPDIWLGKRSRLMSPTSVISEIAIFFGVKPREISFERNTGFSSGTGTSRYSQSSRSSSRQPERYARSPSSTAERFNRGRSGNSDKASRRAPRPVASVSSGSTRSSVSGRSERSYEGGQMGLTKEWIEKLPKVRNQDKRNHVADWLRQADTDTDTHTDTHTDTRTGTDTGTATDSSSGYAPSRSSTHLSSTGSGYTSSRTSSQSCSKQSQWSQGATSSGDSSSSNYRSGSSSSCSSGTSSLSVSERSRSRSPVPPGWPSRASSVKSTQSAPSRLERRPWGTR
ncbi:hypothetical protein P389DRAFT_213105 [Cystobasidium minutum MCA 4210]|uniref:uncharacterized protein n=1 Tax=Cystobasidium minutum MCA 4210 TaxID=1397322 RepID=UPI0034CFC6DB|eukprot:jgi/Rhomi1/213105/estExt_Genemark1.C_90061